MTYTGKLEQDSAQAMVECGWGWAWNAYIYEDGLLAGHGLGDTAEEAMADAWAEFQGTET